MRGKPPSTVSDDVVEYVLTRSLGDFESLTVSSIARKFNINRSYLSQRFKSDKNCSLHDYIVLIKILRSLSILESDKDANIESLAKTMGFSTSDYFRRVFKRKIGTTPAKYRSCFRKREPLEDSLKMLG